MHIKGPHLQLSLLFCSTEAITAGHGSALWPRTETQATNIDFKGSCDRLLFQPGTLDIIIWRAGRDSEEGEQGDAMSQKRNGREKLQPLNN